MQRFAKTRKRRGGWILRVLVGVVVAIASLISFCTMRSENPITGQNQHVAMDVGEEIAFGEAATPRIIEEFGQLHPDASAQDHLDFVGAKLVRALEAELAERERANPYPFEFHLLKDAQTVNAFALPGGQVFITAGLYGRLNSDAQLAGVLGHEMGHVLARHGSEQLAKRHLNEGLAGAVGVASGSGEGHAVARAVGALVEMRHSREDELESDRIGLTLMADAGYDPYAMVEVMRVLEASSRNGMPEFFSTHPKPGNRVEYIEQVIAEQLPQRAERHRASVVPLPDLPAALQPPPVTGFLTP